MKICNKCCLEKNENEFYTQKSNKDGLMKHCKKCNQIKKENWIKRNKDKYSANNKKRLKKTYYKRVYNLSQEEFDRLLLEQNSKCKICKEEVKLFVDHCHKTNIIRGLLCSSCNFGLGHFKDNIELLNNAIAYLG